MASAAPAVVTAVAPGPPRPGSPGRFPRPRDLAGGRIGPSVPSAAFGSVWSRRWSLRMVGKALAWRWESLVSSVNPDSITQSLSPLWASVSPCITEKIKLCDLLRPSKL